MQTEHEQGTRSRPLRLLRIILEQPFGHTKKQLAQKLGVSADTVSRIFQDFANTGFVLRSDSRHRYALAEDQPLKQLQDLLHFSEEDQILLEQAIDMVAVHHEKGELLRRKLASLYDYQKLGHSYLRKPYLSRVDALLQAKAERKAVILEGYRSSNSNHITNRLVEPFHPSPPDDTVHAWDLDKGELRHYRISRIQRVILTDTTWNHENHHLVRPTDVFRIVDSNQVMVHIRMSVGAYNELIERFPLTRAYLEASEEDNMFDLQCMVNHRYLGLSNFILGNFHQRIEILKPEGLISHLKQMVSQIRL